MCVFGTVAKFGGKLEIGKESSSQHLINTRKMAFYGQVYPFWRVFQTIFGYFGYSWLFFHFFWLLWQIIGYFWLLPAIFGYLWLILAIFGYFWLFLVIFGSFQLFFGFSWQFSVIYWLFSPILSLYWLFPCYPSQKPTKSTWHIKRKAPKVEGTQQRSWMIIPKPFQFASEWTSKQSGNKK